MGWQQRAVPDWKGTLTGLKECIEGVLLGIELGIQTDVRSDILALEALGELAGYIQDLQRDLGV